MSIAPRAPTPGGRQACGGLSSPDGAAAGQKNFRCGCAERCELPARLVGSGAPASRRPSSRTGSAETLRSAPSHSRAGGTSMTHDDARAGRITPGSSARSGRSPPAMSRGRWDTVQDTGLPPHRAQSPGRVRSRRRAWSGSCCARTRRCSGWAAGRPRGGAGHGGRRRDGPPPCRGVGRSRRRDPGRRRPSGPGGRCHAAVAPGTVPGGTAVLVLAEPPERRPDRDWSTSWQAGVRGFLPRRLAAQRLVDGVRSLAKNEAALSN